MENESRFTNFYKWNPTILHVMFLARHGCYETGRFLASLNQKDFEDMDKVDLSPSDLIDYTNPRGAILDAVNAVENEKIIFSMWEYFGKKPFLFTIGNFLSESVSNEILQLVDNIQEHAEILRRNGWSDDVTEEYDALLDKLESEYNCFVLSKDKKPFGLTDEIKHMFSPEVLNKYYK